MHSLPLPPPSPASTVLCNGCQCVRPVEDNSVKSDGPLKVTDSDDDNDDEQIMNSNCSGGGAVEEHVASDAVSLSARTTPSKLFSLSMSLLLAAFLQAVRCLTSFIDDTLKNI